jgi:uncharacterized protein YyaL (SSP411 family)
LTNRLARESSPYLLLHAENPVDWYPWGEEAFAKARREDRPIFLSVGYSTCYWCHVMERESFSDPAIADALNQGFVSIKLDREERPDLDEIYMAATQLLTRSGGWPNSLFLTPDLKPFFAGTYFPPRDAMGRPGFARVLASLREAWALRRTEVLQQAETIAEAMQEHLAASGGVPGPLPDAEVVRALEASLAARFDPVHGGFGRAPKFPSPANLFFLLERASENAEAREMLVTTLDRMARGGIQDHLAGGFHRYSTDALWLVPHFEKMLYDNASLGRLYAEADALAPERGFAAVARATLDFVLAEMTGPDGGFHSAIDAETNGHEGAYYTWTAAELSAALAPDDHALLAKVYGFDGRPNFEGTRYVLYLPASFADAASSLGIREEDLRAKLAPGRQALLAARNRRPRPLLDDKVLADWNGLMIGAFARASEVLGEPRYLETARRGAGFVLAHLRDERSGRLLHAWRNGDARIPAFLDDYAFLVEGLLRLAETTGDESWAEEALRLQAEQDERLLDAEAGGYFAAGEDPRLLLRAKPAFDGAVASGNGFAALNLLELAALSGDASLRARAEGVLRAFSEGIAAAPLAHVSLVRAVLRLGSSEGERPAVRASTTASPPAPASPSSLESLEDEAREVVEVAGRLGSGEEWKPFTVELKVAKGWHVYANPAGHPSLVATSMAPVLGQLRALVYPGGEPSGGDGDRVFVYRDRVRLEGEIEHKGGGAPSLELTYQACDEGRCLPPITRLVRLQ